MIRSVRVLRCARRDLQQIHDYIAREAPPRAGPFIEGLFEAIESLEKLAGRGAIPREPALRQRGYRFLVHKEYLIFYKILPKQVRVYRVLHGKRAYRDIL